jgi:hypothetical protein
MTTTPNFDDLTPPEELLRRAKSLPTTATEDVIDAYRAGARHGWEQARQLWPERITDRPPTKGDGDEQGWVMIVKDGVWRPWHWADVGDQGWLHTPRWQPRQPSLQEQAKEALIELDHLEEILAGHGRELWSNKIRRVLEQAGEGQS